MASEDAHTPLRSCVWHLHWQAAVGQSFLPTGGMADRIKERLVSAHLKRQRVLVDFLILPTEIHLIARLVEGDAPGDVAGAIGNFVSRWVREVRRTRSHVMGGPFRAFALESDEAVRQEVRMLAWRPVVLGLSRGPTFYAHGALRVALGLRRRDGFDARPVLRYFGQDTTDARAALARWVSGRPREVAWQAWELSRGLVLAPTHEVPEPVGFREVKTEGAALLVAAAGSGGVQAALGLLVDWVGWQLGAISRLELGSRDARAVRWRALVARLAVQHRLCSSAFVARYFHRAKATLSEQVAASRLRAEDAEIVATPVAKILGQLAALGPLGAGPVGSSADGAER